MKKANVVWVVVFALAGFVQAIESPTIVWVTDRPGTDFDQPWIDILTAEGYTVTASTGTDATAEFRTLDAAKIARLNAANLVIISRKTSGGDYSSTSTEVAQWNGLTAPMLNMTAFLTRNNRWKWLNGTENGFNAPMQVLDPTHSFFTGVPLDENNQVSIIATGTTNSVKTTNAGNGTLLATSAADNFAWIAKWNAGVEYYPGSGQFAGGPRVYFGLGQDVSGAAYNANAAGKLIFLNIVYQMSGATFNRKPLVTFGGDRIVYLGDTIQPVASVYDPEGSVTFGWSVLSGPGTVTFSDAAIIDPAISFSAKGTYTLQFQVNDGTTVINTPMTVYVLDHANDTMLSHWDFEGLPDPNTLVDIANGFNGVFHHTTAGVEPNAIPGHISPTAVDFLGLQYWEVPNTTANVDPNYNSTRTGLSVAVWAKIEAAPVTSVPMLIGYDLAGWRFQINNNRWNLVQSGGTQREVYSIRPVFRPQWQHVVGVYDGPNSVFKLYIDGILDNTATVPSGFLLGSGTMPLQIGNRADAIRMWPGMVDDIRVYNYPLSDAEIAALAAEGDKAPVITAGPDQTVFYKGEPVQLDATLLINDGLPNPLALQWSVSSVSVGIDPEDVIFDNAAAEDPFVTFPRQSGTYVLKLTANDGDLQVEDEVSITLVIPTCADVLAEGLAMVGDLSGPLGAPDCSVDLYDFAVLAASWLECNDPEGDNCIWPY